MMPPSLSLTAMKKAVLAKAFKVKQGIEIGLREYVLKQTASYPHYVLETVSRNAYNGMQDRSSLNELIADTVVRLNNDDLHDEMLGSAVKGVIGQ